MAVTGNPLSLVKNTVDQLLDLQSRLNNAINLTIDTTQELTELDKDVSEDKLTSIKNTMLRYIELQKNISHFQNAFNQLKQQAKESGELPSNLPDLLMENFNTLKSAKKEVLQDNTSYKRLLEAMDVGNTSSVPSQSEEALMDDDDEEEGVVATQETIPLDPLTRKEITDPVRNKICKHTYEREAIMQHIARRKKNARCPMIACTNDQPIHPGILEDNEEVRRMIRKKQRKSLL